jgi:hypothetical protein
MPVSGKPQFRLWLAQLNPTVGDLTANADAARAAWRARPAMRAPT